MHKAVSIYIYIHACMHKAGFSDIKSAVHMEPSNVRKLNKKTGQVGHSSYMYPISLVCSRE
jgi:hypothetical protein